MAGDAGQPLRGGAVHAAPRRHPAVARCARGSQGHRSVGRPHHRARPARRRRLRAGLRESWSSGRRDHRPSARSDLRLRPRAAATRLAAQRRVEAGGRLRRAIRHRVPVDDTRAGALVRLRAGGVDVPDRVDPRAVGTSTRPAVARRRRTPGLGGDAGRHTRSARPPVRAAAPVHDVVEPAPDRRSGVAAIVVQHRDRLAVAKRGRRSFHRRGRGRRRRVLQSSDSRRSGSTASSAGSDSSSSGRSAARSAARSSGSCSSDRSFESTSSSGWSASGSSASG